MPWRGTLNACMKRNSELLKVLAKCKPELREAILKATEDDLLKAIRQRLLNVRFETVKLKPKTGKKLAPHSKHIKFSADKRNSIEHRHRRLVQRRTVSYRFYLRLSWNNWQTCYNGTCDQVSRNRLEHAGYYSTTKKPSMKRQRYTTRNLQRYLTFHDKRMNIPVRINMIQQISWIVYQPLCSQELDN